MAICVAVDCKSNSRQGIKSKFLLISKRRKSESTMAHKNKM